MYHAYWILLLQQSSLPESEVGVVSLQFGEDEPGLSTTRQGVPNHDH
jgi:hypothetical protein